MKELNVKIIVYKSFLSLEFQLFLSTSKFPVLGLPGVKNIATYEYGSYVDITFTIHIRWVYLNKSRRDPLLSFYNGIKLSNL